MEQIGNILLALWNALLWISGHLEVVGVILATLAGAFGTHKAAIAPWLAKFKHTRQIMKKVVLALGDRKIGDDEAATLFWMLATTWIGWWPSVNEKVLDVIPDQQIARLKGYGFIRQDYRPNVAAVQNGNGGS